MIEGHLYTDKVVTKDYPEEMKAQIAALDPACEIIIHHIKSPGGNVYAAWKAIPDLMKLGKPVTASVEGEASSIASWLMIAGTSKVKATNPSTFMIHEPFFPEGLTGVLGVDDLDSAKQELEQIRQSMAEAYAKKMGRSVEDALAMMKKNTRFSAKMAKDIGLVDEIVETEPYKIAAQFMDSLELFKREIKNELMGLFGKRAVAEAKALDLPTKDGKTVKVDTENGDLVGKTASVDGVPCEGSVPLADGRVLMCSGGKVVSIGEAAPQETAEQKISKQIAELQNQMSAIKQAEIAKTTAEADAKKAVESAKAAEEAQKALATKEAEVVALAKENDELKNKTVGNKEKPYEGMTAQRTPVGFKPEGPNARAIDFTKAFIKENMNWLTNHYPQGYFDNTPSMLSILETSFGFTYPGILTTDIFYKPTLEAPALSDMFRIDQDIKFQKQYNLVTELNKIVRPYTGCGAAVNTNRQLITNTTVTTKEFQMYEGWCKDDFTGQLLGVYNNLAQEWLKTGESQFDPAGTPIDRVIMTVLKDGLQRDLFRRATMADAGSTDADYNQIDGLITRLLDSAGASNYCVRRAGTVAGTPGALGIGALSAGNALTYLENNYSDSNILLKNATGKKFFVTQSIWDNYYNSLIGTGAVTEQAFSNLQKGLTTLTYKGIPVVPVPLWDKFLLESDNPLTGTVRHIILLTVPSNHILGVESAADLNKIDSWYEMKDQKRYYRASFKIGYNYLHCDLQTLSY